MADYTVIYDDSVPCGIGLTKDYGISTIPLAENNQDFQRFLKWNSLQAEPLDWTTPIEPPAPLPAEARRMAADVKAAEVSILQTLTYDQADAYINNVILQGFTEAQAQAALTAADSIAKVKAVVSPLVSAVFAMAGGMRIIVKVILLIRDKMFPEVYRD